MTEPRIIKRVGIVGTGVIGANWAAQFLAKGLDASATDPAPDAEDRMREFVDGARPALEGMARSRPPYMQVQKLMVIRSPEL